MTYLLTFSCYGHRLHGHAEGSVDRHHRIPGMPTVEPNVAWLAQATRLMKDPPYTLDAPSRALVLEALRERCRQGEWTLHAVHIRPTHVHVVVEADAPPEKLLHALKSSASQRLNGHDGARPGRKRWARHGSTRWLWAPDDVDAAVQYVLEEQGTPMAVLPPAPPSD